MSNFKIADPKLADAGRLRIEWAESRMPVLTTLREKVVKIGAKVIAHARYTVFQLAEVAVSRDLFRRILDLIDDLRPKRIA